MEEFSGNAPGTGGLVTFRGSSWFMSVVVPYQPYFLDQPATVNVCWGYALFPNNPGDHVPKKMAECTGEEILMEPLELLRRDRAIVVPPHRLFGAYVADDELVLG